MVLISLFIIHRRLGIGKVNVAREEWFFTHLPFSIYLGWITVSTVGNLSVYLVAINWDGWGQTQTFWTVLAVLSLAALALIFLWKFRDWFYLLTFGWVFAGVFYQRVIAGDPSHRIIGLAAACAAVFLLAAAFLLKKDRKKTI